MDKFISFALRGDSNTREVFIHRHEPGTPIGLRLFDWEKAVKLKPEESQKIINHSPDGFAWGYAGSGPAQLALAVLLYLTGDKEISLRYYQGFKNEVIAELDNDKQFCIECLQLPKRITDELKSKKEQKNG